MKQTAEAVLRELPSVVGAFVREDVYGHPREVHLLIRSGPDPRHLARDIRDLLEERLGVPVDQRVISIAQLAEATPRSAREPATAPSATEPRSAPQTTSHAADPVKPAASAEPASTASTPLMQEPRPAPPPEPRLRFLGVETQVRDSRALVRARLEKEGRELVGEAVELEAAHGRARAAAAAALRAITAAAEGHGRFELEHAGVVRVMEREYVLVCATASSPFIGRRPLPLTGAQLVDVDVETAAALAALKAANRVLGLMLRLSTAGA